MKFQFWMITKVSVIPHQKESGVSHAEIVLETDNGPEVGLVVTAKEVPNFLATIQNGLDALIQAGSVVP